MYVHNCVWCMFVYAGMHVRTHTHTHIHSHRHARTHARTHAHTHTHTHACTHARTHALMHFAVYRCRYAYICIRFCRYHGCLLSLVCACACEHTHMRIAYMYHTNAHTHAHKHFLSLTHTPVETCDESPLSFAEPPLPHPPSVYGVTERWDVVFPVF